MLDHERAFIESFVAPPAKARCFNLLGAKQRRRGAFVSDLFAAPLREDRCQRVAPGDLRKVMGAIDEKFESRICYVISESRRFDQQQATMSTFLGEKYTFAACVTDSIILSIVPGGLAVIHWDGTEDTRVCRVM